MPQGMRGRSVRVGWLMALGLVSGAGLTGCMTPEKKPVPQARQVGPGPAASGPNTKLAPGPVGSMLNGAPPASNVVPNTSTVGTNPGTRPGAAGGSPQPASASQYSGALSDGPNPNPILPAMTPTVPRNPALLPLTPAQPASGFTPAPPQMPAGFAPAPNAGSVNTKPDSPKKPVEVAMAGPTAPAPPPSPLPASPASLPGPSDELLKMTAGLDNPVPPPAPIKAGAAAVAPTDAGVQPPVPPSPPDGVAPKQVVNFTSGVFGGNGQR